MTPRRKQRLIFVVFILVGISVATVLSVTAFQENLLYYYSPTQIKAGEVPAGRTFRLGGVVAVNSVKRESDVLGVHFVVTDTAQDIPVLYKGILPDLFREGQGVIAQGKMGPDGVFVADEVLAKHDENYMPPAAGDAVKAAQKSRAISAAESGKQ